METRTKVKKTTRNGPALNVKPKSSKPSNSLVYDLFPSLGAPPIDIVPPGHSDDGPHASSDSGIVLPSSYGDDFDISRAMDEALDPLTGTMRDLKIDDRDLPLAKNFFEFSTKMSKSNPPFSRQMWIAYRLLGEWCPRCSDPRWDDVENVPVDMKARDMPEFVQFLDYGKCPKCGARKSELVKNHEMFNYQQLVMVLGQRAGKSMTGSFISSYQAHRYLKFPKLSSVFWAIQDFTPLTMTFVSLTFGKAKSLLWDPFLNIVNSTPWFEQYHEMLDFYGKKYGTELYRKKDIFIQYAHKNLRFYPSHPNGSILRGDTRIGGGIDELGLFPLPKGDSEEDEQSERANADEAHKSLMNSLVTVSEAMSTLLLDKGYDHAPGAYMLNMSSPMSQRDKVSRLLKDSRTEDGKKIMLGVNLPTWKVNPTLPRTAAVIVAAYLANKEKAERDFGANPPRVHSRFIAEELVLDDNSPFGHGINSHILTPDFSIPGEMYGVVKAARNVTKHPSVLSIDAGHVNNSFTLCSTYLEPGTNKTRVNCVLELMPVDGRRINFNLMYEKVILPLAKTTNAQILFADQWNSLDILHRIRSDIKGMDSQQYSPRRGDFEFVHSLLVNKNLHLPVINPLDEKLVREGVENWKVELNLKPTAHLLLQFMTVRDTGVNSCPEKGEGYTDDIFRSLVLGCARLHDPRVQKRLAEAPVKYDTKDRASKTVAVYISRG